MKNILGILIFIFFASCSNSHNQEKKFIFVSILPQKYFVERIVQDDFAVQTLVPPGHSPHTYEPLPQQMSDLARAILFFRIGMPFEQAWLPKIKSTNKQLQIIDTRKNIKLRKIEDTNTILGEHDHDFETDNTEHDDNDHHHHAHDADPHIWLSPKLVSIQAQTIFDALVTLNPERQEFYKSNLENFLIELTSLQSEFENTFATIEQKKFLVFHPVWGYLADDFGLQQIPIELRGKKPSPKELATIIEFAKKDNIKVIFVQQQFSTQEAQAVAQAIQGKVVQIDPLAENYLENMRSILSIFKEQLK
jgi:zinc transport system substrate-binding protein